MASERLTEQEEALIRSWNGPSTQIRRLLDERDALAARLAEAKAAFTLIRMHGCCAECDETARAWLAAGKAKGRAEPTPEEPKRDPFSPEALSWPFSPAGMEPKLYPEGIDLGNVQDRVTATYRADASAPATWTTGEEPNKSDVMAASALWRHSQGPPFWPGTTIPEQVVWGVFRARQYGAAHVVAQPPADVEAEAREIAKRADTRFTSTESTLWCSDLVDEMLAWHRRHGGK